MRCVLMEVCGLKGQCSTTRCVYWGRFGDGSDARTQCALVHFNLVGVTRDRLSLWLLDLKLKTQTEMTMECLEAAVCSHTGASDEDYPRLTDSYADSARSRASA